MLMLLALLPLAIGAEPPTTASLEEYRAQRLSVTRFVAAGTGMRIRSEYYQGDTRLWGPEIYEILKRPDYVEKYRRRATINASLVGVGAASIIGGFALSLSASQGDPTTRLAVGGALTLGGAVCISVPFFHRTDPGNWNEVNGLIESYNVSLARQHGVPLTVSAP